MNGCVFLDRDGTIIVEKNYLADPAQVELLPRAAEGLKKMADLGYALVVISNQSGVGRGYFGEQEVNAVNERINELLLPSAVSIEKYYYCPHTPEDCCSCRKPSTGMIDQAVRELDIDPRRSFMIGDKLCDIELGRNAGLSPILVRTGYGAELADSDALAGTGCSHVAGNLLDAAQYIAASL